MKARVLTIVMLLVLALGVVACAPQVEEPIVPPPTDVTLPEIEETEMPAEAEPTPEDMTGPEEPGETPITGLESGEVPEAIFEDLLDDLATRTTARGSEITVEKAEFVVWPDGSLGCPEPGVMYTMALENGYHVVFETPDGTFDYRVNENGYFKLCENATIMPPPADTGTPSG